MAVDCRTSRCVREDGKVFAIVLCLSLVGSVGCNDQAKTLGPRAEVVSTTQLSAGAATSAPAATEPAPAQLATTPAPATPLCDSTSEARQKLKLAWPASGTGWPELTASGIWINLWAGWCHPCVEELPVIRAMAAAAHQPLLLLSLDDDERQWRGAVSKLGLDQLAPSESQTWLAPGPQRERWLSQFGLPSEPSLPNQLLIDGHRHLRCLIKGAVEPSDRGRLLALFAQWR